MSHIFVSQAWNQPVKVGGSSPCLMVVMGGLGRPQGSELTYLSAVRREAQTCQETEAKSEWCVVFLPVGFLCSKPILGAALRSSSFASLPSQRKIYGRRKHARSLRQRLVVECGAHMNADGAARTGWTEKDQTAVQRSDGMAKRCTRAIMLVWFYYFIDNKVKPPFFLLLQMVLFAI